MTPENKPPTPEFVEGVNPSFSQNSIYYNGFALSLSPSDFIITLQLNGQPLVSLYASHIIAKTLADKLNQMLEYIGKTGFQLRNLDEMLAVIHGAREQDEPERDADHAQPQLPGDGGDGG